MSAPLMTTLARTRTDCCGRRRPARGSGRRTAAGRSIASGTDRRSTCRRAPVHWGSRGHCPRGSLSERWSPPDTSGAALSLRSTGASRGSTSRARPRSRTAWRSGWAERSRFPCARGCSRRRTWCSTASASDHSRLGRRVPLMATVLIGRSASPLPASPRGLVESPAHDRGIACPATVSTTSAAKAPPARPSRTSSRGPVRLAPVGLSPVRPALSTAMGMRPMAANVRSALVARNWITRPAPGSVAEAGVSAPRSFPVRRRGQDRQLILG